MLTTSEKFDAALRNDEWITEEGPDPDPLPKLPGIDLLVRPVPIRKRSQGGIIIPDSVRDDYEHLNTVGRVLVLGDQAYKNTDLYEKPWCKVGDYVAYGKLSGQKFYWKGVRLLILPAKAVLMVVDKPEWLDENFKGN